MHGKQLWMPTTLANLSLPYPCRPDATPWKSIQQVNKKVRTRWSRPTNNSLNFESQMYIEPVRFLDTQHPWLSLGYTRNMTYSYFGKGLWSDHSKGKQLRSKKSFGNNTLVSSPTEQRLNLGDEIPVRWVDCNIPDFYENQKYELFKIFPVIVWII